MERVEPKAHSIPAPRDAKVEYLFDMIAELAKLARGIGETETGIFLEAILTAHKMAGRKENV